MRAATGGTVILDSTPPRAKRASTSLCITGHIHNLIPQGNEPFCWQGLSEEVGKVLVSTNERYPNDALFHCLAHVKVSTVNVFGAFVVFGIIS